MTTSKTATTERMTARVVGRVQGVGFRWWVVEQARSLGLTGWVQNDADERIVLLAAEGRRSALDELERRLADGPSAARVDRVQSARSPAVGEWTAFRMTKS